MGHYVYLERILA